MNSLNYRPTSTLLSNSKELSVNQAIVLDCLKDKKQSVYQLSRSDCGLITGITQVAIRKICLSFADDDLISGQEVVKNGRTSILYSLTKTGKAALSDSKSKSCKSAPRDVAELHYLLHCCDQMVQEESLSDIIKLMRKTKHPSLISWFNYVVAELEKL